MMNLNKYIDHTLLKANALKSDIDQLIEEAVKYDFKAVCVNPTWVSYCDQALENTNVLTCTVIGFPLGASTTEIKVQETIDAIKNGADEMVTLIT